MYLVLNPADIQYLTGVRPHDPMEMMILLYPYHHRLFCDARTIGLFDADRFTLIDRKNWKKALRGYKTLRTDPAFLTQNIRDFLESCDLKITTWRSPITHQRRIKTPEEIVKIAHSQELNKRVWERVRMELHEGMTERELVRKIAIWQLEIGASASSFPSIVAFWENSAIPHHIPTDRKLRRGDWVLVDMWLVADEYSSDMTRCIRYSREHYSVDHKEWASPEEVYRLLQDIVREIIDFAWPGMTMRELDQYARRRLGKFANSFTHSLGHGVGLDIHEWPSVSSRSRERLVPWMILTLEPGVYLPREFGVRYEEMVMVGERGLELI